MAHEVLILMYHALDGGSGGPAGTDPHYTVDTRRFGDQLDLLAASGLQLGCARDGLARSQSSGVWLTFDDGDLSNWEQAFPQLCQRGLRADFFVNPARVGRAGYCSWPQLREMAAAGMSIQSHGMDHVYFTHLSRDALVQDLQRSRRHIEDALGQQVCLLAPPGGRCPPGLARVASECGYRGVLGSAPGTLRNGVLRGFAPRVAVLAGHSPEQLRLWATRGRSALRRQRLRYRMLATLKGVLGDRGYEALRARLLGGDGG